MIDTTTSEQLRETLKRVFGYDNFRGNQEEIILNVMEGRNTFVIMPTGAGKSLCYQLPAIIKDGTAIVISPLIALMKNQVDQMNAVGINAKFLNSTLTRSEIARVKKETLAGEVKLLYVAPESLTKEENLAFLKEANISFTAVDEAHCISEWGHDFRPEYRKIKSIMAAIGDVPIVALTATATPKVKLDIQKNLDMEDASVFQSSFNRTNLIYEVKAKKQAKKHLIRIVKEHKGESGIVYCLSRKKVEEIAEFLKVNGVNAAPYHAGMDAAVRIANQDAFLNEDTDVIVATIAFGMGIDKPDVRFVVHYDAPKSIEGYYQETGRAGRDGLLGKCVMFYSYNDIIKLEKFNKDKAVAERENARFLLDEMASFAESAVCRRKQLLHYFGEEYHVENCEGCDNCLNHRETFDGTDAMMKVIKAVNLTNERFDLNHISELLRGIKSPHVLSYGHDKLESFASGADHTEAFWKSVIRQTLFADFIHKDIDNPGVFKVTKKGMDFVADPYPIKLFKDHEYDTEGEEEEVERETINTTSYDKVLYDLIKQLRKKEAKRHNLQPWIIFYDPSIEEMATVYPTTMDDLIKIVGVGESKAKKFGQPFLDLINQYIEDNEIETASDVLVKSSGQKSKNKIFIIQQIDKQVDLDEIADSKGWKYEDLLDEIEGICYAGTKLNLDYYIDHILDEERQDDIYDYFLNSETDSLEVAMAELGDYYSEEEVRLMRIKFMSEYAH